MTENIICALIAAGASIICSGITLVGVILGLSKAEATIIKTFNDSFDLLTEDFNNDYANYTRDDLHSRYTTDLERQEFIDIIVDCGLKSILEDLNSREYKLTMLKHLTKDEYKKVRACAYRILAGLKVIKTLNVREDIFEYRYLHYQDVYTALGNTCSMDTNDISLKIALDMIKEYLETIHSIINK